MPSVPLPQRADLFDSHPSTESSSKPIPRASAGAGSEARAEAVPDVVAAEAVSDAVTSSARYASSTYLGCGSAALSSAVSRHELRKLVGEFLGVVLRRPPASSRACSWLQLQNGTKPCLHAPPPWPARPRPPLTRWESQSSGDGRASCSTAGAS